MSETLSKYPLENQLKSKYYKYKQVLNLGGENNMSGLSLEMYKAGLKDGREEGGISIVLNMFKQKLIDLATASSALNMSEKDF